MNTTVAIQKYLDSEAAQSVYKELKAMEESPNYKTVDSYSPSSDIPLTFVEKHMRYLSLHQKLNHQQYISNLKLMTKIK